MRQDRVLGEDLGERALMPNPLRFRVAVGFPVPAEQGANEEDLVGRAPLTAISMIERTPIGQFDHVSTHTLRLAGYWRNLDRSLRSALSQGGNAQIACDAVAAGSLETPQHLLCADLVKVPSHSYRLPAYSSVLPKGGAVDNKHT